MQTLALRADKAGMKATLEKAAALKPQLVLFFAAAPIWQDKTALAEACAALQGAAVIGCSTAGEISSDSSSPGAGGIADDSLSILAMRFENTQVKTASAALASAEAARGAGLSIAEDLRSPGLRGLFALCPGTQSNGSAFARAISSVINPKAVLSGAMAGDGMAFGNTFTLLNGTVYPNTAVAFGLYGDSVQMSTGARSGWRAFGPARRVTKAAGNVLFELDDKPALGLFENYLGDKAADLPRSGLAYPFAILKEDDRRETGVIGMLLGVDRAQGSVILAGDLPQGSLVRLMHADADLLVENAALAAGDAKPSGAENSAKNFAGDSSASVLVSCAGRRLMMGAGAGLEVEAAARALGPGATYAGFYGYGVFGSPGSAGTGQGGVAGISRDLLNQTMMVTHITEKTGA